MQVCTILVYLDSYAMKFGWVSDVTWCHTKYVCTSNTELHSIIGAFASHV